MKIGDRFHPFIRQVLLIFFFWFNVRRSTMRATMSWPGSSSGTCSLMEKEEVGLRNMILITLGVVFSHKSHGGTKLPMRPHVAVEKKKKKKNPKKDQMRKRNLFIFLL